MGLGLGSGAGLRVGLRTGLRAGLSYTCWHRIHLSLGNYEDVNFGSMVPTKFERPLSSQARQSFTSQLIISPSL